MIDFHGPLVQVFARTAKGERRLMWPARFSVVMVLKRRSLREAGWVALNAIQ
jgi:hypothetical protein